MNNVLLEQLIAIPSTADRPEQLKAAIDLVAATIRAYAPSATIEHFSSNGKPSILAYHGKTRPKKFKTILNGHVDVVPAAESQFTLTPQKDRLYGRGTLDMKGAVAVMTQVFCELAPMLDYDLGLQIVADEEIGGHNGTKYQIDQGVLADFVVCGEFTPAATICNESRGICQFRTIFNGKTAHSAYPWDGQNAIVMANEYIATLLQQYPIPTAKTWVTTANVSTISTPNTTRNQVPSVAAVEIDIRYVPGDGNFATQQTAVEFLQQIDPGANIEIIMFEPSHFADSKNKLVQQLAQCVEQSWGVNAQFIQKPGAADGRFYSAHGIPAVIFGLQGEGLHGDTEHIEAESLQRYAQILRDFLQKSQRVGKILL